MPVERAAPQYTFICGCARSGTSVFAELLRSHWQILMGRERYAVRFRLREPIAMLLLTGVGGGIMHAVTLSSPQQQIALRIGVLGVAAGLLRRARPRACAPRQPLGQR